MDVTVEGSPLWREIRKYILFSPTAFQPDPSLSACVHRARLQRLGRPLWQTWPGFSPISIARLTSVPHARPLPAQGVARQASRRFAIAATSSESSRVVLVSLTINMLVCFTRVTSRLKGFKS
jgi:hypothetical protein